MGEPTLVGFLLFPLELWRGGNKTASVLFGSAYAFVVFMLSVVALIGVYPYHVVDKAGAEYETLNAARHACLCSQRCEAKP